MDCLTGFYVNGVRTRGGHGPPPAPSCASSRRAISATETSNALAIRLMVPHVGLERPRSTAQ
jgi:hypothetical protein